MSKSFDEILGAMSAERQKKISEAAVNLIKDEYCRRLILDNIKRFCSVIASALQEGFKSNDIDDIIDIDISDEKVSIRFDEQTYVCGDFGPTIKYISIHFDDIMNRYLDMEEKLMFGKDNDKK